MVIMDSLDLGRVQSNPDYDFKKKINPQSEENNVDVDPYTNIGHTCTYLEPDEFQTRYCNTKGGFSIYSHNVRSLPGKFDGLQALLSNLHTQNKGAFIYYVINLGGRGGKPNAYVC